MKNKNLLSMNFLYMLIWFPMFIGWVFNIIDVVTVALDNEPLTTMFILRIIGIFFFPLGTLLGYFY